MGSEVVIIPAIFIGLPWIIFHYITQWKKNSSITREDENLLDELFDLARRLDERMCSIERIMTSENPNWHQVGCDPADAAIESRTAGDLGAIGTSNTARRIRG
jgi:phage shock protein B